MLCHVRVCQRCETLYCIINKGSKAILSGVCGFTQHCIQSNVTHVRGFEGVLYSVHSGLLPLPGGKTI